MNTEESGSADVAVAGVGSGLPPVDARIQAYLDHTFAGMGDVPRLPTGTFVLDRVGMARDLSVPGDRDSYTSPLVTSYRLRNGVLHNPVNDRRTTKGVFHLVEGGPAIPDDKLAVPPATFLRMLSRALQPPPDISELPNSGDGRHAGPCIVSLLLRPLVVPAVPGYITEKRMEIRFFTPGSLVSNLDFVESIFGNGGDPALPENDASLDPAGWTGHTGCVILAPHLTGATKRELGLPHVDDATERQRRDAMCWSAPDERYNGGSAFKVCSRTGAGVIVTIIADNYFGYCKKEVKTQIGYSANLFGLVEEEHAGGAIVYPAYVLGDTFAATPTSPDPVAEMAALTERYAELMEAMPEGHAVDRTHRDILYVPDHTTFDLTAQTVSWAVEGTDVRPTIPLRARRTYVLPSGYKVHIEQPPARTAWHLVGTEAEGTLCHKPCTVSGGGKSEISKPISDAILPGPVFVADFDADMDRVAQIIERDYSTRYRATAHRPPDHRSILSHERSLGSVIKLLTPNDVEYTAEYNTWLRAIPQYLKEIVFVVKRHHVAAWGDDWRSHFSVDIINGVPGNELKCDNRKLTAGYLRIGFHPDGAWRVFGLREDYHPAAKVQMEDDITVSVTIPGEHEGAPSRKFVENCEHQLFQRPDDAIHRGYDKLTERELAQPGNFISNFAPLTQADAVALVDEAIGFSAFTPPMQRLIEAAASGEPGPAYFVSSAHPRIVDGKPSKNPRYLQQRPDLLDARGVHLARMATRLHRRLAPTAPVLTPVDAVVPGRRNNPPQPAEQIRSLAVYNPIHYMELPELFMEYISSMTGKSPSTTGAGSEGALTKGPFNAMPAIIDLNASLVGYLLAGRPAFISAAGHVGPNARVDHDVSLLVPEVWSRMRPEEREASFLIEHGYLERCHDLEWEGRLLEASRLGYRITAKFGRVFFGRLFTHPETIFTDEMLRPETQDMAAFAEGIENICATHRRVAQSYLADGTIELACPPLRALLHIMADGHIDGMGLRDERLRTMFTREALLGSDWYEARLHAKRQADIERWDRHVHRLRSFIADADEGRVHELGLPARLQNALAAATSVASADYLRSLHGTIGVQPDLA
jgi:hypothetical protein